MKKILKTILFVIVCCLLMRSAQKILDRNWRYPAFAEAPDDMMDEFYQLTETEDFQVVFFGASGYEWDISPMQIYKDTGIVTYNMASSGQPLAVSYFLCQEMFKTQKPKVVVMEASGIVRDGFFNGGYHYILDHMPFSQNKVSFSKYYAEQFILNNKNCNEADSFIGALFPLYQYHERWADLSKTDFEIRDKVNLYRKGYLPYSGVTKTDMTIDWMNSIVEQSDDVGWVNEIENGDIKHAAISTPLYDVQINEESWSLIADIKKTCEENNAQLLLLKTPAFGHPITDPSSWTLRQSQIVKEITTEEGIDFLDLQYDTDLGIDWEHDAGAGTQHLNYLGTKKLTKYIENMLVDKYELSGRFSAAYEEDIPIYEKICKILDLQLESDLYQYLGRISDFDDVTVFFSGSDDITMGMSDEICHALNGLGLQTDFSALEYSDSYLAVIENGNIDYEAYSNRQLDYCGSLANGISYALASCGFLAGLNSRIEIDGTEYSLNRRGMNIVILDNKSGLVLDSVGFDFHNMQTSSVAVRNNSNSGIYLWQYEDYLVSAH